MVLEICIGQSVFFGGVEVCVESLDRGKFDTNIVRLARAKIAHLSHFDGLIIESDFVIEKVFGAVAIQKVRFGLLDDIVGIDEKQKVSISLVVEIHNQSCHNNGLT